MSGNEENSDNKNKMSKATTAPRPSMLRPSVFGSNIKHLDNKSGKVDETEKDNLLNNERSNLENSEVIENNQQDSLDSEEKKEECEEKTKTDSGGILSTNGIPKLSFFATSKNIQSVECSNFVFGENLHERVVGDNLHGSENETNSEVKKPVDSALLFSSIANNTDPKPVSKEKESKSLTEVAQEYEESRAKKRKYDEVETFTGEEDEVNIIDLNCKLFAFINRNWEERGRGSLRLNDSKDPNSFRVVFRTSGNLRLLLNTKVWSGMVVEKSSSKSLRLTAMDNLGQIKVFLVMSRPDDINVLYTALAQRIQKLKEHDAQLNIDKSEEKQTDTLEEPSSKKVATSS